MDSKECSPQLSKMLVQGEIGENSRVYIDATADREDLTYRVEKNGGLVNGHRGEAR